ncbi:MAG: BamA/TamA family outer membrane protein [Chitinophagales bacterium]
MLAGRSFSYLHLVKAIIAGLFILAATPSCKVPIIVKKYPVQKPFVFDTKINLIGNFSNEEKVALESGLRAQLDDSMRVRKLDKLLWSVMKHPPVYDSTNADKSIVFMHALLVSQGYFNDSISYRDTVMKKKTDQYRTYINFDVKPGNQWRLDSVSYNLGDSQLQRLTESTRNDAVIKKGDPFAKGSISAEIDRLTELYRNNGYMRFTRDGLIGMWDTVDVAFLQPAIDPLEQLVQLQRLKERRQRPSANLEFRLRNVDSLKLVRFYNGDVTVFPDYTIDTAGLVRKVSVDTSHHLTIIQFRNKFKPKIFPPNIYLPYDSLYRIRRYIRTVNRLNLIGTWRLVNIDQIPRHDKDTVDYIIRLTPAKKYSFTTNLEGSLNQSATSGRLFGIGINVGVQNRNFRKRANFDSWNVRYGIELGSSGNKQVIQTQQISLSRNIVFPRALIFDKLIPENRKDNYRSSLFGNLSNTIRRFLYDQSIINAALGYEYQRRNKLWTVKFPNIEYSLLNKKDSLDSLIKINPSLKNIFTDGLVFSTIVNFTVTGGKNKNLNVLRVNSEGAPLFLAPIHSPFLDTEIYRFVKVDLEGARLIRFSKTAIALRCFIGIGVADPFNTTRNPDKKNTMPFFKQYVAGGPNSMRAWALRRLGPGSIVKDFTGPGGAPDRYGDVQFESNAEYRFPIGKPLGIKVDGAVFIDVGNIWLLKKEAGPPEAVFHLNSFLSDLAIGSGVGLRVDFGFFVIRLDYSYKVKDPSPSMGNKDLQNEFFGYSFFKGTQFQLGIGYPFIF